MPRFRSSMPSRTEASFWAVLSKVFSARSCAFNSRCSASSPASLTASLAANATCSTKADVICRSNSVAPTSVTFGAIALDFSLT